MNAQLKQKKLYECTSDQLMLGDIDTVIQKGASIDQFYICRCCKELFALDNVYCIVLATNIWFWY